MRTSAPIRIQEDPGGPKRTPADTPCAVRPHGPGFKSITYKASQGAGQPQPDHAFPGSEGQCLIVKYLMTVRVNSPRSWQLAPPAYLKPPRLTQLRSLH